MGPIAIYITHSWNFVRACNDKRTALRRQLFRTGKWQNRCMTQVLNQTNGSSLLIFFLFITYVSNQKTLKIGIMACIHHMKGSLQCVWSMY